MDNMPYQDIVRWERCPVCRGMLGWWIPPHIIEDQDGRPVHLPTNWIDCFICAHGEQPGKIQVVKHQWVWFRKEEDNGN